MLKMLIFYGCVALPANVLDDAFHPVQLGDGFPHNRAAMQTAVMLMSAAEAGQRAGLDFQLLHSFDELIGFHQSSLPISISFPPDKDPFPGSERLSSAGHRPSPCTSSQRLSGLSPVRSPECTLSVACIPSPGQLAMRQRRAWSTHCACRPCTDD